MNVYEVKIVNLLLRKYYKRQSKHKDLSVNRRITLNVNNILKQYSDYNVDINEKELVNKAITSLESRCFIDSNKLRFSDDYEKIFLIENNIVVLEKYAEKELGLTPRTFVIEDLNAFMKNYEDAGEIVKAYILELENTIQNSSSQLDALKEKDILKVLSFLENNQEYLYLREASMLIFGDSKYLENNRRAQVSSFLLRYYQNKGEGLIEDENLFERFNIYDTDQDICIKGPVTIIFDNKEFNIDGLSGGVSFSIKDVEKIKSIVVRCERVITVENKTSFLRMNDDVCYIYLGGFATKPQIIFIKKIIDSNPDKEYLHFGDIDAGGFWIHKKLCEQTMMEFKLFHMSKEDLMNTCYKNCLKELTDLDVSRLTNLKEDNLYVECITYMLEKRIKLEQEIISLTLSKI